MLERFGKAAIALSALTVVAVIGCGGHGTPTEPPTGSNTGTTTGSTTGGTEPNSTVRSNLSGDDFSYTVSGTYMRAGATTSAPTSGTATDQFTADTYSGASVLEDVTTTNLQVSSEPIVLIDTQQISTSNATLAQSDDGAATAGAALTVTNGAFVLPTSLSMTYTFSGTEGLSDGTTIQASAHVTGFQTVTTPAGTFNCWTISRTLTWSDQLTQTQTIQFSPDIGAIVQKTETDTEINGYSASLTYTLNSYSLG